MRKREIQILFVARENAAQGYNAGIPCDQVLQRCACLMQHAVNRVHTRTHVQQLNLPVSSLTASLTPAENLC